jgi:hypothetical protein
MDHWAMITTEKAHSGQRSLRLRVSPEDGQRSLAPEGSSLWLDSGRRYRLSAWVCYDGEDPGEIRLSATQIYFTLRQPQQVTEAQLAGAHCRQWRRLELEFTTLPHDPGVVVQLHVQGDGSFFADDVLLEMV